jgi:hypothetical protein
MTDLSIIRVNFLPLFNFVCIVVVVLVRAFVAYRRAYIIRLVDSLRHCRRGAVLALEDTTDRARSLELKQSYEKNRDVVVSYVSRHPLFFNGAKRAEVGMFFRAVDERLRVLTEDGAITSPLRRLLRNEIADHYEDLVDSLYRLCYRLIN